MDIKILSKLLGHADVNITYNIYVNLYGDAFEEMYDALCKVAPTRKTGGSLRGCNPLILSQRLKALAFALLQPLCVYLFSCP